jgi:hypothetical protein
LTAGASSQLEVQLLKLGDVDGQIDHSRPRHEPASLPVAAIAEQIDGAASGDDHGNVDHLAKQVFCEVSEMPHSTLSESGT